MKVAPIDIAHKSFNRKMMGLDPQEVMDFLRQIAEEMEALIRDRNNLREQLREKELQIIEFRERDELLKNTITTATKMSEKMQADAEREARLIISDAKQQGEMIIRDARDSLKKIFSEITELKKIRMQYENNLRALISSHLTMMEQGHKVMPDPEILNNPPASVTASAAGGGGLAAGVSGAGLSGTGVVPPGAPSLQNNAAGANSPGAGQGGAQPSSSLFNRNELDTIKQNVTEAVARSIRNIDL